MIGANQTVNTIERRVQTLTESEKSKIRKIIYDYDQDVSDSEIVQNENRRSMALEISEFLKVDFNAIFDII